MVRTSACDYKDCPRYQVMIDQPGTSKQRKHYCSTECRDNERKRRTTLARVNVEARKEVIGRMVEQHKIETTVSSARDKAAAKAMLSLRFDVLTALDTIINGTPTGPIRDKLTEANIILLSIVDDARKTAQP